MTASIMAMLGESCEQVGDCNSNAVPDVCEFANNDCNLNGTLDTCEEFLDCNSNGVPDTCELHNNDCNINEVPDECDIAGGTSTDCNFDSNPDECASLQDCNRNNIPDICELVAGTSQDCNSNGLPDDCDLAVRFESEVIFEGADFAGAVFAADLDGDLDLDVLSASFNDDTVAWYPNLDGMGQFGGQQVISDLMDGANCVIAIDIDGDLDNDVLASSGSDDTIAWFENLDGRGSFGGKQVISNTADGASAVFAADLDGDLDVDVLSASVGDNKIAWYENLDGIGAFGGAHVLTNTADSAQSVFAIDLDGDTDLDVLAASFLDDTVSWFENLDGAGNFGPEQVISSTADAATSVLACDIDGDLDNDVLVANSGDDAIVWHENLDGAGNFGPPRVITELVSGIQSVATADMDNDGDLDVLSASFQNDRLAWYENEDGQGAFGFQRVIGKSDGASAVHAADINGDGYADALSTGWFSNTISWYPNQGDNNCNSNLVPDECELGEHDCNTNGTPDDCELENNDCNFNGIPDDCEDNETDCNANGWLDLCEIAAPRASFMGLGDLPGGNTISVASGVSDDGSVVVGWSQSTNGREGFVWTPETGMVGIGDLSGGSYLSSLRRVTPDGHAYVGWANEAAGAVAIRGTQTEGIVPLVDFAGGGYDSAAYDMTPDGSVIVGYGTTSGPLAARWTSDTTIESLGDLPGGSAISWAWAVSDDGNSVAGYSESGSGSEAFLWTTSNGMIGLGDLAGGSFGSVANDISGDGSVVVGEGISEFGTEAMRWTESEGMVGLGDLSGGIFESIAWAVSADGRVIVGSAQTDAGREAFIWTADEGMRSLREMLENDYGLDLTGWLLSRPNDVSADGGIVVGRADSNPQGYPEAFVAAYLRYSRDCNNNGVLDECELVDNDCDSNGVFDACQSDKDGDGIPDACDGCANSPGSADIDADGDVDLQDYDSLTPCLNGPGAGPPGGCDCLDFDLDGDVDLLDFAEFQAQFAP
ncbi:MAG: VCBS repeat-containing protein [Phycisphaerales bacterium]|nr:VCBS repeat-containing protein [Phycisphaerales bacterium]